MSTQTTTLRRGMAVCLTGKMPLLRQDIVDLLRACGLTYDARPDYADLVVYGDNARRGRTDKYVTGERRGRLMHVDDFFRALHGWDPDADDILERYGL